MADFQNPAVPSFYETEIETFLPDGWKEGDDIFAQESPKEDDLFAADGQEEKELLALLNEDGASEAPAPTTDEKPQEATSEVEEATTDANPDGGEQKPVNPSRTLTLKVNHKEETLDVNAMSDEDLIALLQKGRAFDAMKERDNEQTYRRVYQEQIDAGMTEAAARMIAQNEVGGKTYALTDDEKAATEEVREPAVSPASDPVRDLQAELGQLNVLLSMMGQRPMDKMPDEVAHAIASGISVPMAYMAYQQKEASKAAASLQKENKVLKQNAASAARAPVRGVTGGDNSPEREASIYDKGFDAGLDW